MSKSVENLTIDVGLALDITYALLETSGLPKEHAELLNFDQLQELTAMLMASKKNP